MSNGLIHQLRVDSKVLLLSQQQNLNYYDSSQFFYFGATSSQNWLVEIN